MGKSQLKKLRETLKSKGLTGQTNGRQKTKNRPSDSRRDRKEQIIKQIRQDFNPFEVKVVKKKFGNPELKKKGDVSRPGVSRQIGEEERKTAYELQRSRKGKTGGLFDKRFGENNSSMTTEEKMLERFTKERQKTSNKRSLFDLEDDDEGNDEENGGLVLTHSGKAMSFDEDENALGAAKKYINENQDDEEEIEERPRRKTKAEVMKEVIAKSKFYKHERQKKQNELESHISELNEGFDDVMSDLRKVSNASKPKKEEFAPSNDLNYGQSLKKLLLERRAVPADRTKTVEEIESENKANQRKLEEARQLRMEGMDREGEADDLDEFWEADEEVEKIEEKKDDDYDDEESSDDDDGSDKHAKSKRLMGLIKCPESEEELLELVKDPWNVVTVVNTVLSKYKPNLAPGNNEKLAAFTPVILSHILHLADTDLCDKDYEKYSKLQEELIKIVKKLSKKYTDSLTTFCRGYIQKIETRLLSALSGADGSFPRRSDMVFFTLVGVFYSTSDHYHLVVTPAAIVLCQSINLMNVEVEKAQYSLFVCDLLLKYQRISKRYVPEVVKYIQSLMELCSQSISEVKFSDSDITIASQLRISHLNKPQNVQVVILKALEVVNSFIDLWRDVAAFHEITSSLLELFFKMLRSTGDAIVKSKIESSISTIEKIIKFSNRKPLALQSHRAIAIATHAPKYEDNFNPERKSYDLDTERQEINKLKSQIKKEKKLTVKELRKDNRFMARESIKQTKEKYESYHRKMASIVNSINTIEGNERNQYDKEKRLRKKKASK